VGDDYPFGIVPQDLDRYRGNIDRYADRPMALDYSAPSKAGDAAFVEWATRYQRLAVSPGQVERLTRVVMATDVRDVLPVVRVPLLVLHTADNRFLVEAHGRYLAERVPGARFVELPGADHLPLVGPGAERELEEIERFVTGGVGAPRAERQLATVLFTDIVRSTEQLAMLGDRRWTDLLRLHDDIVRRAVDQQRGMVVKNTGDGVLAIFDGPSRAVTAALALVQRLAQVGVEVRAGVHTGEIEVDGGDVRGLAVHTAARVMGVAGGGQLLASRTVRDLSAGSGHRFEALGAVDLKGLPDPLEIFAVAAETESERQ
jgi:class 3 adenylate cyclase